MKTYPSILNLNKAKKQPIPFGQECIGFYKYDGSNLRFKWDKKRKWFKAGTRNRLINDELFSQALPLFDSMKDEIEKVILENFPKIENFTVYCEFFGESSFAGAHFEPELKQLILFDVWLHKRGFIDPWKFVELFGKYAWSAKIVFSGIFSENVVNDVIKSNGYLINEGVVFKGLDDKKNVQMVKVKTEKYINKLKEIFDNDFERFV